jgi:uncharacterized lipoprotein YddW (UPF0748 family)
MNQTNQETQKTNQKQIRGVWICSPFNSTVLTSEKTIADALKFLADHKFNYVFPAVWNQGYTAFPSQVMEDHGFPQQYTDYKAYKDGFDPLATIIREAGKLDIKVIPWLEYGFAASPYPCTNDKNHILKQKPEWSALDSEGNVVQHGGLTWMNSLNERVQQFMQELILEIVEKYPDIDGIQGDDRFPAMPFLGGYDTKTKEKYNKNLPKYFENRRDDEWNKWVKFRADKLTNYLRDLSKKVKEKKSDLIVSMAPSPYPYGLNTLMQDSDVWVKYNIVDFLHPQIYRHSVDKYKAEVDKIIEKVKKEDHGKYAPGIAFRVRNKDEKYINLTSQEIVECVRYNGQKELGGQVFFSYEGLRENNDAMAKALLNFWKNNS